MFETQTHTVKKGDTLIGIAKRYSHRDWRAIWDAPVNKGVRSKRKKPDLIQPGDRFAIPLTDKEREQLRDLRAAFEEGIAAKTGEAAALDAKADASLAAAEAVATRSRDFDAEMKAIIADLEKARRGAAGVKIGVDLAAMATGSISGLTKLAKTGMKASKATGKELAKLNEKAGKQATKIAYTPIKRTGLKESSKYLLDEDNAISQAGHVVGSLVAFYIDMTSPSFWGGAFAKFLDTKGDGSLWERWSKAVTYDFAQDVGNQIQRVDKTRLFHAQELRAAERAALDAAKTLKAEARAALDAARSAEGELARLPVP